LHPNRAREGERVDFLMTVACDGGAGARRLG
jgi:hypothetical protein